ncbi:MAG: hypothetical protein JW718_03905 [Desulfovibrionaceae bacterium]|nr:hypothetical protein [Desulfovibrionaceae bacterium]
MNPRRVSTLVLALFALLALLAATPSGAERLAALDIGSGSVKLKVADLDPATGRIQRLVLKAERKLDLEQDLARSRDDRLGQAAMDQGLAAVAGLKALAVQSGAERFLAAGTSAFRRARNGQLFAERISKDTGIRVLVISQKQEALLGLAAAARATGLAARDLAVWDIGAGSMQIVCPGPDGPVFFFGHTASVSFKDLVTARIKGLDPEKIESPNPLDQEQLKRAADLARALAAGQTPEALKTALSGPGLTVVGIGGVHWYSLRLQTGVSGAYTRADAHRALMARAGMTDRDIDNPFAATEVTNLALVLGFMRALGIDSVLPLDLNMADGLLASPGLWEESDQAASTKSRPGT